jgi:RimJ/RimL family protein N-acetyltransferase
MTPFRPPEVIETDDLLLRRPELNDAQALFDEMLGDRETMSHLPTPRHTRVEDTLAFIEKSALGWQNGSLINWVLEDKATGRLRR